MSFFCAYDVFNLQYYTNTFSIQGATRFDGDISDWDISSVKNFSSFVEGASSFSGRGLCYWGVSGQFPFQTANTKDMFKDSGCEFQDSPEWEGFGDMPGPFCGSDCVPTTSPTSMPSVSR